MKRLNQAGMAAIVTMALLASGPALTQAQSASRATRAQDVATATPVSTDAPTETAAPATATGAVIDTPTAAVERSLLDEPVCSPSPGAGPSLRFAVIGDYGQAGSVEADVAALVAGWAPDLVVTAGDNNYPAGAAETIDDNIGQYYHDFICPYTGAYGAGSGTNRFLPALGNHEWVTANAQPYLDYFELPGNERYYDHVQGPVHFFIVDSDPNEPDGIDELSTQAAWLQAGLAASSAPWQIVVMHHAPYSSSSTHGSTTTLQWPFKAWGADAVIAGHDHTYERLNIDGIPFFVNGLGGRTTTYPFGTPLPGSVMRYNADHGAMLVDATATSIDFRFVTSAGATIDRFEMTKALAPLAPANFVFQQVASGLTQPVLVTHAGDGSGRLFIVEQPGRVRVMKNGALLGTPFLNIQSLVSQGSERGLLALAFHPEYETNGLFYVLYTNLSGNLTLSRFTVSAGNPDIADATGSILLTIPHPGQANHNGGTLAFGPDGYLYWSTGDGGGGGDPGENAQDLTSLLGKILRLDVDSATPYAVPPGNPFYVDGTTEPELIWAYGLRNPWRMSFDRLTADLTIGDVGQSNWEEIDFQPASSAGGENYGWDQYEGNAVYEGPSSPDGKTFPVAVYPHSQGCSVTGGYVYRGSNFPSLNGYYFFGDYCSGRIWSLHYDADVPEWVMEQLADTSYSISSFGEDEAGQLYFTDLGQNRVLKLAYKDSAAFASVRAFPAEGTQVCSTPELGADLQLSDATRTAGGLFDLAKVRLELDGANVTSQARVRSTMTHPNSRATLEYTPASALTAGTHTAALTYETADGPLTALWQFTVAGGTCLTSSTLLSAAATATPAAGDAASTPATVTEAQADSAPLPASDAEALAPAAQIPTPDAAAAPLPTGGALPPMRLPGCLPSGAACPGMIRVKP